MNWTLGTFGDSQNLLMGGTVLLTFNHDKNSKPDRHEASSVSSRFVRLGSVRRLTGRDGPNKMSDGGEIGGYSYKSGIDDIGRTLR